MGTICSPDPTSLRTRLIKKNPDSYHTKSYTTPGFSNQRCDLSVIYVMLDQRYFTVAECPSWYVKRFIFPILPAACPTRIEKTAINFDGHWYQLLVAHLLQPSLMENSTWISSQTVSVHHSPRESWWFLNKTWNARKEKYWILCQTKTPKKLRKTHLSLEFAPFPGVVTLRIVTCLVWGFLQTFLCHHSSGVSKWPLRDVASPSGSSSCSPSGSSSASSCCWFRISRN